MDKVMCSLQLAQKEITRKYFSEAGCIWRLQRKKVTWAKNVCSSSTHHVCDGHVEVLYPFKKFDAAGILYCFTDTLALVVVVTRSFHHQEMLSQRPKRLAPVPPKC